jgi:hypothetical protein
MPLKKSPPNKNAQIPKFRFTENLLQEVSSIAAVDFKNGSFTYEICVKSRAGSPASADHITASLTIQPTESEQYSWFPQTGHSLRLTFHYRETKLRAQELLELAIHRCRRHLAGESPFHFAFHNNRGYRAEHGPRGFARYS